MSGRSELASANIDDRVRTVIKPKGNFRGCCDFFFSAKTPNMSNPREEKEEEAFEIVFC